MALVNQAQLKCPALTARHYSVTRSDPRKGNYTDMTTPLYDSWNATLYAGNSAHHRAQDAAYLSSFTLAPTDHILDLGSGTGEFTNKLAVLVPQGLVLGVDASRSQIEYARRSKANNVEFSLGHLEALDALLEHRKFDAAISRATLHWVNEDDHPLLLRTVAAHLRPGGFMRAEFGGYGQMASVITILDDVATSLGGQKIRCFFPEAEQYRALLQQAGFDVMRGFVRLVNQTRSIPTFEALVGLLRSQPYVGYEPNLPEQNRQAFRELAEKRARTELKRADGSYDLDFVRLDLLAFSV
jgi:trans-aconitate methyltransferase